MCVNTWEHVYIFDYGVAGKRNYLVKWWDTIDWARISNKAHGTGYMRPTTSRPGPKFHSR